MIDLIGYIGALLFAICALPQAIKCYKEKHATGLSWLFLLLWLGGEICLLIYTIYTIGAFNPLVLNYVGNLFLLAVIIRYKICPKKLQQ